MLKVYTSQYRYSGPHRLDITVKSNDPAGRVFAPNWPLVQAYKNTGDEQAYREGFHNMMIASLDSNTDIWMKDVIKRDFIVLVCFCKSGAFCHRILVADYLVQLGAKYMGEIGINDKLFEMPTIAQCFGKNICYYYCIHESNCVWVSNEPDDAEGPMAELTEEIDIHAFNGLIAAGYTNISEL